MKSHLGIFLIALLFIGCVSKPPVLEYTLARAALDAAEKVEAAKFSPNNWLRAKEAYVKAEQLLADKDNDGARRKFVESQKFSERAEERTRFVKFKKGDVAP